MTKKRDPSNGIPRPIVRVKQALTQVEHHGQLANNLLPYCIEAIDLLEKSGLDRVKAINRIETALRTGNVRNLFNDFGIENKALEKIIARLAPAPVTLNIEAMIEDYRRYDKAVMAAARAGHKDHPTVAEFITVRRRLGDRDTLRLARSGLERKMKRPYCTSDIKIWDVLTRWLDGRSKVPSYGQAQMFLKGRGLIDPMSPQAFHELVKRLDLQHRFEK